MKVVFHYMSSPAISHTLLTEKANTQCQYKLVLVLKRKVLNRQPKMNIISCYKCRILIKIMTEYCCNAHPARAEQLHIPEVATDTWNTDHFSMIFYPKTVRVTLGHFPFPCFLYHGNTRNLNSNFTNIFFLCSVYV